ncbi:MAG: hypothetical protein SOZ65_03890, partial [Erysipelotrichaceae bacterium]|nr:hypothetical protein [Erysipelotrichaceae bacterium]
IEEVTRIMKKVLLAIYVMILAIGTITTTYVLPFIMDSDWATVIISISSIMAVGSVILFLMGYQKIHD